MIVQVVRETWGSSGRHMRDYTLYTGILGTAYLVFKAYQVTENRSDLNLCSEIVKACDSASEDSRYSLSLSLIQCIGGYHYHHLAIVNGTGAEIILI